MLKKILFTVHSSLSSKFAVLDYSGTHSLFARINCYRNLSNFAVGCLLSRVSQQVATLYRKSAFTLAETLIVMGIIGVVAALTLPNLNSSTGDKETVAKVKKIYQNLEDAVGRAEAVYGPVSEWYKSPNGQYQIGLAAGRLIEFMKISKDCGTDITSCFPDKLQGPSVYWFYNSPDLTRTIVLADGTAVLMTYESQPGSYLRFYVDINGKKGANIPGIDAFQFNLTNFGVIPSGHDNTKNPVPHKVPYFDCTDWVINIGNMDYLKMDSSKKCNNNPSIILDGVSNTSCK